MRSRLATSAWVVWDCALMQSREMARNPLALVIGVVQPAVLILIVLGQQPDIDAGASMRLLTAVVLTALWNGTVWVAAGILQRELELGTLAANVTSVHPGFLVLLGKSLGATTRTVTAIVLTSAATVLLIGAPLQFRAPVLMAVGLLTVVLSSTALGMVLASVFLLTRYGPALSNALMFPIYILGGMLIPVSLLPEFLRPLSTVISLRWAQQFLVGAAAGQAETTAYVMMLVLTAGYFALGILTFNRVVDRARRGGTLELH